MSKTLIVILAIILLVVVILGICISSYNKLVKGEEKVKTAWSQVENVYQRRADLIPNLVKTVQGAADFESSTLQNVIEARANATSMKVDANNLNEASIQAFQKSQDQLSSALSRLMVVVERYPELKATKNFQELQAQLEGTENRITVERNKFNETVREYNVLVRRFPSNIFASMFGFEEKGYFQAKEGAENVPEVDFNSNK